MKTCLNDLDLTALMCSRVCHDLISPVGAITNGLEVLDEETDAEMHKMALDLVRKSAQQASAKLQFCRLAFGAAGSADAVLDLGEAGKIAYLFVGNERIRLDWSLGGGVRPKQEVKMVLNLMVMAMGAIPRGGVVRVEEQDGSYRILALGEGARVGEKVAAIIEDTCGDIEFDARLIQAYYTVLLASQAGFVFSVSSEPERITFCASRKADDQTLPLMPEDQGSAYTQMVG